MLARNNCNARRTSLDNTGSRQYIEENRFHDKHTTPRGREWAWCTIERLRRAASLNMIEGYIGTTPNFIVENGVEVSNYVNVRRVAVTTNLKHVWWIIQIWLHLIRPLSSHANTLNISARWNTIKFFRSSNFASQIHAALAYLIWRHYNRINPTNVAKIILSVVFWRDYATLPVQLAKHFEYGCSRTSHEFIFMRNFVPTHSLLYR